MKISFKSCFRLTSAVYDNGFVEQCTSVKAGKVEKTKSWDDIWKAEWKMEDPSPHVSVSKGSFTRVGMMGMEHTLLLYFGGASLCIGAPIARIEYLGNGTANYTLDKCSSYADKCLKVDPEKRIERLFLYNTSWWGMRKETALKAEKYLVLQIENQIENKGCFSTVNLKVVFGSLLLNFFINLV